MDHPFIEKKTALSETGQTIDRKSERMKVFSNVTEPANGKGMTNKIIRN